MNIPFVKAHGARNDFLLTWRSQLPANAGAAVDLSQAICNRYTGVGADGCEYVVVVVVSVMVLPAPFCVMVPAPPLL